VSDAGTVVTPDSARAADSAGATPADSAAPQRPKYPTAVVRSLGSTGGGRVITVAPSGSSLPQQTLRTDANGVARISLTAPGKWYVKFVHMAPAAGDATVDYESQWATLTFELR
jgi:hypothetical protein